MNAEIINAALSIACIGGIIFLIRVFIRRRKLQILSEKIELYADAIDRAMKLRRKYLEIAERAYPILMQIRDIKNESVKWKIKLNDFRGELRARVHEIRQLTTKEADAETENEYQKNTLVKLKNEFLMKWKAQDARKLSYYDCFKNIDKLEQQQVQIRREEEEAFAEWSKNKTVIYKLYKEIVSTKDYPSLKKSLPTIKDPAKFILKDK